MAENKTRPTGASVDDYIASRANAQQRTDCRELMVLFKRVTRHSAKMWGPSIVGFGKTHYKYASGREGETFIIGFSPRKESLVLYLGWLEQHHDLLPRLGPHTEGKGCLYIKRLSDVDQGVLRQLLEAASTEPRR